MPAHRTARERARAELTAAIKDEARRQCGERGADGLSLRAVARELGMVSSALYRYFPSRDDLLTALIIDAYNDMGAAVEQAAEQHEHPRERWRGACHGLRTWARTHPHEYSLLYGTPIPGYQAPQDTVSAARRVPAVLLAAVSDGWKAGEVEAPFAAPELSPLLREQIGVVGTALAPGVPEEVLARTMIAWSQLFGMVGFERTGHFVGSVDPADEFFTYAVEQMTLFVGLS
ncbi:TetR/AcrR family transcriptional regulator [Prauserella cavernicola]|uniref:TetR/AcrR family transcriptional regulator n=1 Tax=Prauserella cavernicola TaxID=2800127 RepID=A0A934QRP5_9PSEU|nr:TetR/AcrR family transcriptional regulator [Prauserella cavernicola]MBK1784966.1 TetR/AcrR family transcriptional regulator [Prauserella cavernicola]